MTKVVIVGEIYNAGLEVGGGPIYPGGQPSHPWVPPGAGPSHPWVPPAGAPGSPTHPIYIPGAPPGSPGHPSHPIYITGDPSHPIYVPGLPPGHPSHPIAGHPSHPWVPPTGSPPSVWPGPHPSHPIAGVGGGAGTPVPPEEITLPEPPAEYADDIVVAVHRPGQDWEVTAYDVAPDQGQPQPTPHA